jgi:hypothetical protein
MALSVVLSGQAYISLMDRIDHAHHHAHFANPLAGDVQFAPARHDHDATGHHHDHETQEVGQHTHGPDGHHHTNSPADHQHGDSAVVFLAAKSFVLVACPVVADRCEIEPPAMTSITPRGPDHPPKPSLEIRV